MISHNNDNGSVIVSERVYTQIAGATAAACFGVKGMAGKSEKGGLQLLRRVDMSKGVVVNFILSIIR